MALNKTIKVDKIEIVGDYKAVQVRTATIIDEDGTELNRSFHRHVLHPGTVGVGTLHLHSQIYLERLRRFKQFAMLYGLMQSKKHGELNS